MAAILRARSRCPHGTRSRPRSVHGDSPDVERGIRRLRLLLGLASNAKPLDRTESASSQRLLEAAFLTLAWFWLLLPTQNPWYLVWCLPFLPFARSRAWLLLSGLAFTYYLRFWLTAQFPNPLGGLPYPGPQFFDFVVTWLEYFPWFIGLLLEFILRKKPSHSAMTVAF